MWIIVVSWESDPQTAFAPYDTQEEAHTVANQIAHEMMTDGETTGPDATVTELRDANNVGWGAQIWDEDVCIDIDVMGPIKRHNTNEGA